MNIKTHVLQLLGRSGMTPTEAKFYFAAHKNPKLTVKELQNASGLSRTSAYRAFENLKELGLITSSQKNWRQNVEAVSLKTVAEKLAKEQRKLRKIELELKSINDLMGLTAYSHLEEPLEIITDQNKIDEKLFSLFAKPWEHFLCYGSAERLIDVLGDQEERDWVSARAKKGRNAYVYLTEIGNYAKEFMPNNDKDLRFTKICVDKNNQDYVSYIFDDEVVIWQKNKELGNRGIVITDPLIARMQQNMFRKIWNSK